MKFLMLKVFKIIHEENLGTGILDMAPNQIIRLIIKERLDGHYKGAKTPLEQIEIIL